MSCVKLALLILSGGLAPSSWASSSSSGSRGSSWASIILSGRGGGSQSRPPVIQLAASPALEETMPDRPSASDCDCVSEYSETWAHSLPWTRLSLNNLWTLAYTGSRPPFTRAGTSAELVPAY